MRRPPFNADSEKRVFDTFFATLIKSEITTEEFDRMVISVQEGKALQYFGLFDNVTQKTIAEKILLPKNIPLFKALFVSLGNEIKNIKDSYKNLEAILGLLFQAILNPPTPEYFSLLVDFGIFDQVGGLDALCQFAKKSYTDILIDAVKNNHWRLVFLIINAHPEVILLEKIPDIENANQLVNLLDAASDRLEWDTVKHILEGIKKLHITDQTISKKLEMSKSKALYFASAFGNGENVKMLLSSGADLSYRDICGNNALHAAIIENKLENFNEIIKNFLDNKLIKERNEIMGLGNEEIKRERLLAWNQRGVIPLLGIFNVTNLQQMNALELIIAWKRSDMAALIPFKEIFVSMLENLSKIYQDKGIKFTSDGIFSELHTENYAHLSQTTKNELQSLLNEVKSKHAELASRLKEIDSGNEKFITDERKKNTRAQVATEATLSSAIYTLLWKIYEYQERGKSSQQLSDIQKAAEMYTNARATYFSAKGSGSVLPSFQFSYASKNDFERLVERVDAIVTGKTEPRPQ